MLLSMWMIANRLSSFDLQIHIKNDARPVLKSPRLAYATDCVMVYPDGNDVVYIHEDDTIRIKNISLTMGFELIQSVFDFYDEWINTLRNNLRGGNYERIINTSWMIFHNPLVLLNGQFQVLAMSDQYVDGEMDEEWRYLSHNHYVSFESIKQHRKNRTQAPEEVKPCYYRKSENNYLNYNSLSCVIWAKDRIYGRIIVLEKERYLNTGDAQLLTILADELKTTLTEYNSAADDDAKHIDFFSNILEGKGVDENCQKLILKLWNWKVDDSYCLFYLKFRNAEDKMIAGPLGDVLRRQFPDCCVIRKESAFYIIQDITKMPLENTKGRLCDIAKEQNLFLSESLVFPMLDAIPYLRDQAVYAMDNGRKAEPDPVNGCYLFEKYATDYFIERIALKDIFFGVHPVALDLWIRSHTTRHNPFKTYLCYLENNRSLVRTADKLFIHRNTLVYRLQKIEDHISLDRENYKDVDYLKLSMNILALIERRIELPSDRKMNSEEFLPYVLSRMQQWDKKVKDERYS